MKRLLFLLLSLLFLSACTPSYPNANRMGRVVADHKEEILLAVERMRALQEERVYVAMEVLEKEGEEPSEGEILVRFASAGGTREPIDAPELEALILALELELIFFQTASDSRQSVIFSYTKEDHKGIQSGFYYSFDGEPCAWWGRTGNLQKKDDRWIQLDRNGVGTYFTLSLGEGLYYFEKNGSMLA